MFTTKNTFPGWTRTSSEGTWAVSGTTSAKDFSAVGYYFAHRLREELNCPVGIINVSIGGTPIESWVSQSALNSHPQLRQMVQGNWLDNPVLDDWCKGRARSNLARGLNGELEMPGDATGPNHSFKPGFMFAAGVQPFHPMSIKGILWYQGESNGDSRSRIEQYNLAFPLLVKSWRAGFQNPSMPIAFVQLPAMGRPNWPLFREFQRRSLAELKNVGMAITIDHGHPTNVHPTSKTPVGERLAQWALVNNYGKSGPAMGPLFRSISKGREGLVLTFESIGDGLKTSDALELTSFEVSDSNGVFHKAAAKILGKDKVLVVCPTVRQPVDVRYAWSPYPKPGSTLENSAGMPASPFTSEESF